jgi:hypothetical protein
MPRQPTVTEIRLDNITNSLTPALALIKDLNDAFGPPFFQPISNITLSLMSAVLVIIRTNGYASLSLIISECEAK